MSHTCATPSPAGMSCVEVCPIARTDRRGRAWLPTTYADVTAMARDIEHFSSANTSVIDAVDEPDTPILTYGLPPITSDPPLHTWTRRLLLPWFSHARVESYEPMTRALCGSLIDAHLATGPADAAAEYAQQIPVRVIGLILGVPEELSDTFTGWVRDVLEFADDPDRVQRGMFGIGYYLWDRINERRDTDGDDLLTYLLHAEVEGGSVDDMVILGMAMLTMIAGIDTTWSAIGSSLWHLATNDEDRERLVADPALMDTAVEELLRAYSPVTMARIVTEDVEVNGCPMKQGDKLLLEFSRLRTGTRPPSSGPTRFFSIASRTGTWPSARESIGVPDRTWPGWSYGSPSRSGWCACRSSIWPTVPRSFGPADRSEGHGGWTWCSGEGG